MFNRFSLTKPERDRRDAAIAKLMAITTREYAEFEPLVLDAVRGIGPAVWTWLDEGPGYSALTDYRANPPVDAFWRLRTVRNTNRALFDAVNEKPKRAPAKGRKPSKKANDARVQRLYTARCSGIQISVLDIGKVFKVAERAMAQQPDISDEQLGNEIAEFVETIRVRS